MKKYLLLATYIVLGGFILSGTAYYFTKIDILYTAAIALGTTFYHFAMRLTVAFCIDSRFHNQMDYTNRWFQEKRFEPELYKKIRVKQWKKWLPSFNPKDFLLEKHSAADILRAACQAEIIHEIILPLSFVPVLFSVWFGVAGVFCITSCAAFFFDGAFVILQRYNRPRLLRSIKNFQRREGYQQ